MYKVSTAARDYINGNYSDLKRAIFKETHFREADTDNPPEIVAARTMDIYEYLLKNFSPSISEQFSLWIRGMATR